MPRTNPDRTVNFEAVLAGRIRQEREARGWTMETLAQAMTDAGCAMQKSAIAKIESPGTGERRRRITLDEAVTFAGVLGTTLERLLIPAGALASKRARALWLRWEKANDRYLAARREVEDIQSQLMELADSDEFDDVYFAMKEQGDEARSMFYDALVKHERDKLLEEKANG